MRLTRHSPPEVALCKQEIDHVEVGGKAVALPPDQVWPVPLRYRMIRSGQVHIVPQGWPSCSRGVFSAESQDLSRT